MIYKLFSVVANGDGLASLDIQDDGFINAILMSICPTAMDGLSDVCKMEISFMSSNTFVTNDTRGSIAQHCITQAFLTQGGGPGQGGLSISGLSIEVSAGERIFLHGSMTGGLGGTFSSYIYMSDGNSSSKLRPPRRRR